MRTLLRPVVPSVGLLGHLFLCFRDGFLSFSVSVLWSVFVVGTGGHCWTMLTGNVIISDFSMS